MKTLNEAVEVILTTREFCGDEIAALHDWESENRIINTQEKLAVFRMVETVWRKRQLDAGVVFPLSQSV